LSLEAAAGDADAFHQSLHKLSASRYSGLRLSVLSTSSKLLNTLISYLREFAVDAVTWKDALSGNSVDPEKVDRPVTGP
jgi:hypothetical protein